MFDEAIEDGERPTVVRVATYILPRVMPSASVVATLAAPVRYGPCWRAEAERPQGVLAATTASVKEKPMTTGLPSRNVTQPSGLR